MIWVINTYILCQSTRIFFCTCSNQDPGSRIKTSQICNFELPIYKLSNAVFAFPTKSILTVKEAHAVSPLPPFSFGCKRNTSSPKARQMLLAGTVQKHRTFMQLGHALAALVFYYSRILNVCDLNAAKIFLLELKGDGGQLRCPLLQFQYSLLPSLICVSLGYIFPKLHLTR